MISLPRSFPSLAAASLVLVLAATSSQGQQPDKPKPKFAPGVTTLADDHEYLQKNKAADFWRLMPHYAAQHTDRACTVATSVMVVNAARDSTKLSSTEELATSDGLLEKVGDAGWKKAVAKDGHGISLAEYSPLLERSFAAYGVTGAKVTAVHATGAGATECRALHETLVENERSATDFIIANVLQSALTGDPEGAVGHMVVIAAYDAPRERVLILDPDRRWYEPYWVPLDALLAGMATSDKTSGKNRGYVRIELRP